VPIVSSCKNQEEYNNQPRHDQKNHRNDRMAITAQPTVKKQEDDPYGSGGRREKQGTFTPAEEDTFQTGVHSRP
jgi:hypothetical protein